MCWALHAQKVSANTYRPQVDEHAADLEHDNVNDYQHVSYVHLSSWGLSACDYANLQALTRLMAAPMSHPDILDQIMCLYMEDLKHIIMRA
jgi:hypothetical protein